MAAGARAVALALPLAACGSSPATTSTTAAVPAARVPTDSTSAALIPPNLGSLRQDDISIILQPTGIRATALPLDESVIRTLAPDSYRSLRGLLESRRAAIAQRAQMRGVRDPRVWYLTFYGLTPNARFVPTDLTITAGGRDYRPFDILPISDGFGAQRVQPREQQSGLLLFEEGVEVNQPLVVTMGSERNTQWSSEGILGRIEAERARIRARLGRTNR
jgi:hypothetical protein